MKPLPIAVGLYGLVNLAGGIFGFMKAQSVASLIAGGLTGVILIACALMASSKPAMAYRTAGIISVGLAVWWGSKAIPAMLGGTFMGRSQGNFIMAVSVFALLAGSHFAAMKKHESA